MKPSNIELVQAMTSQFQNGKTFRRPSAAVIIENQNEDSAFYVTDAWLPDVISIEIDTDIEVPARTFTIVCSNANGLLSPDYRFNKYAEPRLFHEVPIPSPWRNVLLPETQLSIHFGYQGNFMRMLTGTIDDINIDSEGRTITLTGRSMYKKAHANTLRPTGTHVIMDKKMNVGTAVEKLLEHVGLDSDVMLLKEPGSNEPFLVEEKKGVRREYAADIISSMVDSTFITLVEDKNGKIIMKKTPTFSKTSPAVHTFDDFLEIKEADFKIDTSEMYCAITVKCGEKVNRFTSQAIKVNVLGGNYRETEVEYSWADTYEKRRYVAKSLFNQMGMKWRKMTIGVPAYLSLELLDVVLVRERVSQQNGNLHVRGIKYMYTTSGLFQLLELADNTGFRVDQPEHLPPPPPPPPSDLPPFTVTEARLIVEVWDFSREDGDRMNVYFNGAKLKSSFMIRNKPYAFALPLKMGPNVLKFVGVSAGTLSTLSGRFRVKKANGSILYDGGSLPDLEMPRTNIITKSGYYAPDKRPVRNWVITRV